MRIILTFLSLSFLLGCHQPSSHSESSPTDGGEQILEAPTEVAHDKRDIQDTDLQQLSCEEAIDLYVKLAVSMDRSCEKDDDCILLGQRGNCDCLQSLGGGAYPKTSSRLIALHQRIFEKSLSEDCRFRFDLLPCIADYSQGLDYNKAICENNQCYMKDNESNICTPPIQP